MDKIAIAISTRNRPASLWYCLKMIKQFTPKEVDIFIVDDASDETYFFTDYAFKERVGISRVKNKCLQLCYESGADKIFLFDDDAYPLCDDWYLPYINSGEHHLCRTFYKPVRTHENIAEHRLSNGCMMYFTRHCIETVGGFDTNYKNKFEHVDLTRRIHNAGLTRYMHQDVINSDKLIYCMDENNEIPRSFTQKEMQQSLKNGHEYFMKQSKSSAYIEFRT